MSRTTSVRRALRLALVPAVAAGVLALPGAVAFADSGSPAPVPTPTVAPAASATPAPAPATATPTPAVSPAPAGAPGVRWGGTGGGSAALPKGGAQTGEGAVDGGSATGLVLGAGLAAAGAAGIGLLVVRRRAAARG
ncbi:hypothetical protein OU787_09055 [Kitasatospora sp. YST-16]|uniref:hypothetical protein n=1 Tax=Kitasatospora sp. YST-16 TaxID=2998080 RepID=UPI002283DA63|nr:hypothetical protein [Kitasatospora sp. YST-16]WAL71643.1 hypothetical protein OU787_09055 [Kitasatospora sp. YST-16]WNW37683.1 hypothetical protein RKE32_09015 [Streptomyces sp. Li-HN-5-13]